MSSLELSNFIHLEGGRNLPNNKFTRNEMMTIHDIAEYRKKNNNTGIYASAYIYDSTDVKEANLYGDFYLDFDSEEDFEKAREDALLAAWYLKQRVTYNIPESFLRIFFSGKKGLHIVVPAIALGVQPDKHLNEYYKVMAKKVAEQTKHGTIDEKIYDRRRLFRIANSRHHSTNLYKIPLSYFELVTLTLDEIKEKAQMPQALNYTTPHEISRAKKEFGRHIEEWYNRFGHKFDSKKKFGSKALDFTPACINELIESGPQNGQRNNTAAVLTSFWKKQGESEQGVWDNLVKWNGGSITEGELKNTMQSVYSNDYEYGCSTLETLATCIGNDCPLYKARK